MRSIERFLVTLLIGSVILCIPACGPASLELDEPGTARFAVLVSVNGYLPGTGTPTLNGPKNDMDAMATVLRERYGFSDEEILRLHGAAAKEADILAALETMVDRAVDGGLSLFAFAGHGHVTGDDDNEEANGRDETICPYDRRDIRDDTLNSYFARAMGKGSVMVTILDACHSGNAFKPGEITVRQAGPGPVPPASAPASIPLEPDNDLLVFLAAAGEEEFAGEKPYVGEDGRSTTVHGMFTHALLERMRTVTPETSWESLMVSVTRAMRADKATQNPAFFGGGLSRRVLGTEWVHRAPHFRVIDIGENGRITVDQGEPGGLSPGALIAVFPTDSVSFEGEPLGLWRVSRATATRSEAVRIEEVGDFPAIEIGYPAILFRGAGDPIRVALDPGLPADVMGALEDVITRTGWLEAVGDDQPIGPDDFSIRFLTEDGRIAMAGPTAPMVLRHSALSGEHLARRLLNAARMAKLLRLEGTDGFAASERLDAELLVGRAELDDDGYPLFHETGPRARPAGKELVVHDGDALVLRYRNKGAEHLYVTALYLSADGSIHAWNLEQYNGALAPGAMVDTRTRPLVVSPPFGTEYAVLLVSDIEPIRPEPFMQTKSEKTEAPAAGWGMTTLPFVLKPRREVAP